MGDMRTRERFDADWRFHRGDIRVPDAVKSGVIGGLADVVKRGGGEHTKVAFMDREMRAETDPDTWPVVALPHDYVVEGKIARNEGDRNQGFLARGTGFYRKVFVLPEQDRDRKITLEFDGIFRNARIWVNGHHLLDHPSGYTSFTVDITDVARFGDEGPTCVLVRVDASEPEGWWYEGGGIYRHVWLTKTSRVHVGHWGTYVTTPVVTAGRATVRVETTVVNETAGAVRPVVETVIVDAQGKRVATGWKPVALAADGRGVTVQSLTVAKPRLWSPENPVLYQARTTVKVGGKVVDTYETVFGIRTIKWTLDGFFLNGSLTPLKGMCNHQDFAGVGVALPDSLHEYKIKVLKGMGANAYRCAHHPPAPELLEACDRLGMMVMDENRKLRSSETGLADLDALLYRDRNHPSVIVWSMENEEHLEGTAMGARILRRLARRARQVDPTRPTTAAMNHGWWTGGYADQVDIVGFNYGENSVSNSNVTEDHRDLKYHREHPGRRLVGTETNSTTTTRGIYADDPKRGYLNAYGTTIPGWTVNFEVAWRTYLRNPFLTGIFTWTGFDYRGEPTPYGWPCVNSHFGVLDTCGFPKDGSWFYRAMWRSEPLLHVFPHWNWKGREGKPVKVTAFTNVDRVDLYLNGKLQGSGEVPLATRVEWDVPFAPGELVAVGLRKGKPVIMTVVATTGPAAAIRLDPDRGVIAADGRDAVPVRVSITDELGRVAPTADDLVKFSVAGPAKIIGVGNGNPSDHAPDKAEQRKAFNGYCLVILQSTGKRGTIRLLARARGLKTARILLRAS